MRKEDEKTHIDIAVFGIEVERFMSSAVGKYIINRAELDRDQAVNELKSVEPSDVEKVRFLQNKLNTPDKVISWLAEAIEGGKVAYDNLKQDEAEALS